MSDPVPTSNRLYSLVWGGPKVRVDVDASGFPTQASDTATWKNASGAPMFLCGGYLWIGEGFMNLSDTAFSVGNSNGDVYVQYNWDHYQNPTGVDDNRFNIICPGNGYFLIMPDDVLTFALTLTGPYTVPGLPVNKTALCGTIALLYYKK